jgi:REase_MTES_1575/Protein of unknown function (DUF4011)
MNNIQIKRQLLKYRDSLEGFTLKNSSIFYKQNDTTTINLSSEENIDSNFFTNELGLNKYLRWSSKEFEQIFNSQELDLSGYLSPDKKGRILDSSLYRKLEKLNYISDNYEMEYGVPCLFLLGPFLSWNSNCNVTNSPIFKIPVYIKKSKNDKFYLLFDKKAFSINEILIYYLNHFFNIQFENEKEFTSANYALHYLAENLRNHNIDFQYLKYKYEVKDEENHFNQFLIYDFMCIDLIENDNLPLFKDYNNIIKNSDNSNLIYELLTKSNNNINYISNDTSNDIDNTREKYNLFPFSFDSGLHRLFEFMETKKSIIASFPPGVEKNSVILNIIFNYLANKKSVLFISESYKYLNEIFAGVKSLNSENKAVLIQKNLFNKNEIFNEISLYSQNKNSPYNEQSFFNKSSEIDKVKFEINNYVKILQEKHLKSGLRNIEIIHKSFTAKKELCNEKIFNKFGFIEWDKLSNLLVEIDGIQYFYNRLDNNLDSPWLYKHEVTLKTKKVFDELNEIKSKISSLNCEKKYLQYKISQFILNNNSYEYLNEYSLFIKRNYKNIDISYDYKIIWERNLNWQNDLARMSKKVKRLILEMEDNKYGYLSIKEDTDPNLVMELENYYKLPKRFSNWCSKKYWRFRKILKDVCSNWDGTNRQFIEYRKYIESYEKLTLIFAEISSKVFLEKYKPDLFIDYAFKIHADLEKMSHLFQDAYKTFIPTHFIEATQSFYSYRNIIQIIKDVAETIKKIEEFDDSINMLWNNLSNYIELDKLKGNTIEKKIATINLLIEKIDDIDFIHQYNKIVYNLKEKYNLVNLDIDIIESLSHHNSKWKDVVYSSVIIGWLGDIISHNPTVKNYGRDLVSKYYFELLENEIDFKENLSCFCQNKFHENFENLSEQKVFKKLSEKLSNNLPDDSPQYLSMDEINLFLKVKPCWFMTPNDVSRFLPLTPVLFDLVIFDSIPQLNMNKYLPSIYRGKQILILNNMLDVPESLSVNGKSIENKHSPKDMEYCIAKGSPHSMFKWVNLTYNEALLSFANYAFYDGELNIAPKNSHFLSESEVQYIDLSISQYDSKNANFSEIDEIVNHFLNIIKLNPYQSCAMITTSMEQALIYKKALNIRIKKNSSLEWISQRIYELNKSNENSMIFINDIQNITNKKVDTVLFAIDNSFLQNKNDKLENLNLFQNKSSENFINKLITCTKKQFIVLSSLPLSKLDMSEKAYHDNYGLCVFGRFLKYTKALSDHNYEKASTILKLFKTKNLLNIKKSNEFLIFVKKKLESRGYQVIEMVGFNNIYLDLAIQNPLKENHFILGIECDDGILHSSQHIKDKVNIRPKILKDNGWNIEKIYSIDWLKEPDFELNRLDKILQKLIQIEKELITKKREIHLKDDNRKHDYGRFELKIGMV